MRILFSLKPRNRFSLIKAFNLFAADRQILLCVERRFLVFDKFCFSGNKLLNCPPGNVVRFDVGNSGAAVAFEWRSTGCCTQFPRFGYIWRVESFRFLLSGLCIIIFISAPVYLARASACDFSVFHFLLNVVLLYSVFYWRIYLRYLLFE